ncbi:TetR family transcriptional regulator [Nocardia aurantiaca]|uniref:TetR family transcriptional regulator n=1 Tax=Nocardia aurantiaca TaxID=2675850 RepID=A0A6I3KU57_9NOCA|nr:TetR family transcriptional regulator [Nocardia aurantiaca]MTE14343.1 TetR family transcriptional regulator [Nocardia aurantiaca]
MSDLLSSAGRTPEHHDPREAGTLDRILDSARILVAHRGFERLTVRDAAAAAGVTASSAYVYFGSNAQLISEMLWRGLIALPTTRSAARRRKSKSRADLRTEALQILGLRSRTAREVQHRIHAALGPDADNAAVHQLEALYTAALFDAGTGYAADSFDARSPEQVVLRILGRR